MIRSQAVLIAIGINWDGRRQILGVEFVVSDDHDRLKKAIREVLKEAAWQRCYVHFLRDAHDHIPPGRADDDFRRHGGDITGLGGFFEEVEFHWAESR